MAKTSASKPRARRGEQSGLLSGKSGRIGGRVSPAFVKQAKRQTGIVTDTDLIEFALAAAMRVSIPVRHAARRHADRVDGWALGERSRRW